MWNKWITSRGVEGKSAHIPAECLGSPFNGTRPECNNRGFVTRCKRIYWPSSYCLGLGPQTETTYSQDVCVCVYQVARQEQKVCWKLGRWGKNLWDYEGQLCLCVCMCVCQVAKQRKVSWKVERWEWKPRDFEEQCVRVCTFCWMVECFCSMSLFSLAASTTSWSNCQR